MDGLIVKQPYARRLVSGSKKIEYRTTKLPRNKINRDVYILTTAKSGRKILGTVMFTKCVETEDGYEWHAQFPVKFDHTKEYVSKFGAVIWINNVEVSKCLN